MSLRELVAAMETVSGVQAVINENEPLPEPVPGNYISDLSLVTQELDWAPTIGIAEGIGNLF